MPSNVSSGLGGLPLRSVWYKGKENKSWPTDPTLPNSDKLDGPYSYSLIMPYFTTNDMMPIDVHNLGKKQLDKLYPMVRIFSNSLRNCPDKNDSNNGNEHVGMQKRC